VDVLLGVGNNAIFSRRWRAIALDHHILVGDRLVFCFVLGMLEVSVQVFNANRVHHTYLLPMPEE
jgi:hypothetical protein